MLSLACRRHRYIFEEKASKVAGKEPVAARLQEIGPRFTLRLRSLQVRSVRLVMSSIVR